MFQKLIRSEAALRRHREAPFAAERERYLQHCADLGATYATLRQKGTELLWIARLLDKNAPQGVGAEQLDEVVRRRTSVHRGRTTAQRVINIARPWLRFLGWWREQPIEVPFQELLNRYITWMRDERGFTTESVRQLQCHAKMFLQWYATTNRQLSDLRPVDIDHYFASEGVQRWSRISTRNVASALRMFFRYAEKQGVCDGRLANTIRSPRVYALESLPFAPSWSDVQKILAVTLTAARHDVRDRAILMLLAIYGMRSGEVASLRLDQLDWQQRKIRLFRLKRRQPQTYPLIPSVAEALARYIDTVRPRTSHQQVFIGLNAPQRPLTHGAIYRAVSKRFRALDIQVPHRGPHALRHACAARLVANGLTLKEIGDHLGHRSTSATRIYAKVDLAGLREVGDFDLGDLQ
jgi:site-specific recombinase XerD